jgi:hypothetical protein
MCLLKRNYKHRTRWYDDYGDGMTSCVMEWFGEIYERTLCPDNKLNRIQ